MDWKDYFSAVEKWEQGEHLDEREARMVAYGWTAGTCGQRVRPNDAVKVRVAQAISEERKKASDARNLFLQPDRQSK